MANAFFVRCDCRNRRFTGGKSRFLQEVDGRKGIASAADELCSSALILYHTSGGKTSIPREKRTHRIPASIALALCGGKVGTQVGGRCGLREFRTSADVRVPFPQGKGTKGCRGPARIPCGAPAPGPPADKRLASVEPRRGASDGVPFGSALTAPLKTYRFQREPVLRGGRAQRG